LGSTAHSGQIAGNSGRVQVALPRRPICYNWKTAEHFGGLIWGRTGFDRIA